MSVSRLKRPAPPIAVSEAENPLRRRIIGAAFEAFMENGYAATSTLEIATRAKVSKRDLYANFPNKAAVLLACITSRAARMRLPADLPVPQTRDALAAILTSLGVAVIREVCAPAVTAMYRLAISEAKRSPDVARILDGSRAVNRDALAELLRAAQTAGILADGDAQRMMEQFFALLWGDLMVKRLLGAVAVPKPAEIDRRARAATEAFLKLHARAGSAQPAVADQGLPPSPASA